MTATYKVPYEFLLDYFCEYELGKQPAAHRRRVPFSVGNVRDLELRVGHFRMDTFGWRMAQKLEGRGESVDGEGVWPINHFRCNRRSGTPGSDLFPQEMLLSDATPAIYEAAREMRSFCYFRARNAAEALNIIAGGHEVRYSSEITSEWYDPADGIIDVPEGNHAIRGSHAVPLFKIVKRAGQLLAFPNSWGAEWGHHGWGLISLAHFDRFVIEGWTQIGMGLHIPIVPRDAILCREWKWSLNSHLGIHGREIVDAQSTDRLAWAFCRRHDGFLDVEEFFVWPSDRNKGYGTVLAQMVKKLATDAKLPLRLLISYADTELENAKNLDIAAKLFGVEIAESDVRWVHKIGTTCPKNVRRQFIRPQRPAFILENLRPNDEKPIESVEYSVFFGTNRKPIDSSNRKVEFGVERDRLLHVGMSKVTIPQTHRFGSRGKYWLRLWNLLTRSNPRILESRKIEDETTFENILTAILAGFGHEKHNLLYVHGFNVSFDQAIVQAAQFGVDLKVPGATFVFSWPSAARMGGYLADEATVEASLPLLDKFVKSILRCTGDAPLSIIVHSMGNRAVLRMLEGLALDATRSPGRIRNLISAAPDVDAEVFRNSVLNTMKVSTRTTMYAARADAALLASGWLHDYSRAGLAPPVLTIPGMDTVLVEGFDLLTLGHSYYAEAASLLHDMFQLIHFGVEPGRRANLIEAENSAGEQFWKLSV